MRISLSSRTTIGYEMSLNVQVFAISYILLQMFNALPKMERVADCITLIKLELQEQNYIPT